ANDLDIERIWNLADSRSDPARPHTLDREPCLAKSRRGLPLHGPPTRLPRDAYPGVAAPDGLDDGAHAIAGQRLCPALRSQPVDISRVICEHSLERALPGLGPPEWADR